MRRHTNDAIKQLRLGVKLFRNVQFADPRKPIQTHIILITEAILALQDYLLNVREYDFVVLGLFLQDLVENMFSLIRRKRPNPTALQMKQSLRQIVIARLSGKVKGSSYELDDRTDSVELLLTAPPNPQRVLESVPNIPPSPPSDKTIMDKG